MEAAGLAFGVVPVVITTARAYRTLTERLYTLRHRHRVARRLWLKFRFIQARIRDAFQHFLSPVLQQNDPWQLMQDNALTAKQQEVIAAHINQSLGAHSAAVFVESCKEISTIFEEVRSSLTNIEILASADEGNSRLNLESSKKALDVTLHESRYEKQLEELRTWVGELSYLLSTNGNHPKKDPSITPKPLLPLPSSLTAINEASRQLGQGLEKSWTCLNTTHSSHKAALWFDAQLDTDDSVHMNVAISCQPHASRNPPISSQEPQSVPERQMWLHIRSVSPNVAESNPLQYKRAKISSAISTTVTRNTTTASSHKGDQGGEINSAAGCSSLTTTLPPMIQDHVLGARRNLEGVPSVCCYLCAINFSRLPHGFECCRSYIGTARGYLGMTGGYKHLIINHGGPNAAQQSSPSLAKDSRSVMGYLSHMTTLQQLKTACELTTGLLKFSHTPWLEEDWSLSDISYLASSSFDHTTLHVSKRLQKKPPEIGAPEAVATLARELQTLLGIRNASLASLGHALLELAYRKPLKTLRQPDDPHNAVAARRLIDGIDTIFGMKYRRIVRKCLEADFVVDCTDLSDGRLRTAVYNDVALELDGLAKDFEQIMQLAQ
ncbi:hypothetical protein K491DRAFT_782505 [Lophiostoma macrostomum CBS 122681]|uniref:DUF7580 domain-containing protein n=1 Tax=Lophiostoma macrostomum CBS 122681 TaxID=1314788 RepID=A0A6A6SVF9_9PLEO|nr:hypothetical protein K491DRAFT_782505 [Lophiostoma macrostomum CBS 122681]